MGGIPYQLATITGYISQAGVIADPTALTLVVTNPNGASTTYYWPTGLPAITRTAMGQFQVEVTFGIAGEWTWVWNATGAVVATINGAQLVEAPTLVTNITIQDQNSNPLNNANVAVYVNPIELETAGYTNSSGIFTCSLEPGVYDVEVVLQGAVFANPYTMTVPSGAGPYNVTYSGTTLGISSSNPVTLVKLFGFVVGSDGRFIDGVRVVVETVEYGQMNPWVSTATQDTGMDPLNVMVRPEKRDLRSNAQGYWEANVVADSKVRVEIPDMRYAMVFRVPNDPRFPTLNLKDARPDPGANYDFGIDSDSGTREGARGVG